MQGRRKLEIETPEGVSFSLLLASPMARFLAWIVDMGVIAGIGQAMGTVLRIAGAISPDLSQAVMIVAYFAVYIGYGIVLEGFWRGQTLGKKLLSLRVMDVEGLHLRFSQVVIRNLMRMVDMLPVGYLVGGIACMLNRDCRRLGDIAANTIVVRNPELPHPDLAQLLEGKFNSLLAHPALAGRLRRHASAAAAGIAIQALVRRDQFDPEARVEVFREIAGYFRAKVELPEELAASLTDEQMVRNSVEVLAGRVRPAARAHG